MGARTMGLGALGLGTLGLALLAPTAHAAPTFKVPALPAALDAKITVERAATAASPTLTVRYSGAAATLVELRVNGRSLATRAVSAKDDAGETTFTLALADLKDGENAVEIRLFDGAGTVIGTHKSTIQATQKPEGPILLTSPKNGATVQGPLEMTVGFGRELKSVFVSFFVDDDFKSMTNFPPYSFVWDSTKATNGWHEIEAWAVDEGTETYKTRKVRVFVNNPGGRTERVGLGGAPALKPGTGTPTLAPARPAAVPKAKATPDLTPAFALKPPRAPKPIAAKAPAKPIVELAPIASTGTGRDVARPSGLKPLAASPPTALGPQAMTPTGTRVFRAKPARTLVASAPIAKAPIARTPIARAPAKAAVPDAPVLVAKAPATLAAKLPKTRPAVAPLARVSVAKGMRLTGVSSFAVLLNDRYVEFDVAPRVDEGVPMTPFRHLVEKAGGAVDWTNATKTVNANADGKAITVRIGDANATLGAARVRLEAVPYLERGRAIVPLSFLRDALGVNIEYDRATNHVLITQAPKTTTEKAK